MSAPRIAPPAIEKECEVFARRMAVHLAKREYAHAWRILELAATQVETAWGRLAPSERPERLRDEAPDRM